MRKITHIVLHCTATQQTVTIAAIQAYWRRPKPHGNGWKSPGYHYIIKPNGDVVQLAPLDNITNGVSGHNAHSIHISYIGGVDAENKPVDNRTPAQLHAMADLVKRLREIYPDARVVGHRDFLTPGRPGWKDCPSFDVKTWLTEIT